MNDQETAVVLAEAHAGADGPNASSLAAFTRLQEEARAHVENSKAANTRRAYRSDWADFTDWCRHHGLTALPATPETVALYLTDCAKGLKTSTLQRRIATISQAHQAADHETPTKHPLVRAAWQGIRREKGVAPVGKDPALIADVRSMVESLPGLEAGKRTAVRDRALLLIGFAGAMRRSELVGLNAEDVQETSDGLVITIRRSKTDQEGAGRKVGIPYGSTPLTCPVRALKAWRETAANALAEVSSEAGSEAPSEPCSQHAYIKEGIPFYGIGLSPLFRSIDRHGNVSLERLSDQTVARIVKRALTAAGRNPEVVARFAGHSLRAGLATQAAMSGASERSIQDQTGHKSLVMLRRYIRDGSLFRENAAARVGL